MASRTLTLLAVILSNALTVVHSQGGSSNVCSNTAINAYNNRWGYLQSDSYPSAYSNGVNCWFQFDVNQYNYEYIAFRVLDWQFDGSSFSDRLNVMVTTTGSWTSVADLYAADGDGTFLNNFRSPGSVRFNWYTDGYRASNFTGTAKWRISWTFQKYVFGCELFPQPYIAPNTTKSGILKSPYFPDWYPVNSYCLTYIDVDQSTEAVEFLPIQWKFREGDTLTFYVGDILSDEWTQYEIFSASNTLRTFTIYGADIKVLFVSDHVASAMGYYVYWRVIPKEKYPLYKKELLAGYWPMTAAHRGRDIVGGCHSVAYPGGGTRILPSTGPGRSKAGSSLRFVDSYLDMTSATCVNSTLVKGSWTISLFAQTAESIALVEYLQTDGNWGYHLWANFPAAPNFYINPVVGTTATVAAAFPSWQYVTSVIDIPRLEKRLYVDARLRQTGSSASADPPATKGFLIGRRDGSGNIDGRLSCLSMYKAALSAADLAQTRAMCEKFHDQYKIYDGSSLVAYWPMSSKTNGILDTSGNGFHGFIFTPADVTMTTGPSGTANRAYSFSGVAGSGSYGRINADFSMLSKSYTISVYITSLADERPFFSLARSDWSRGMEMWTWIGKNDFHVNMNYGSTNYYTAVGVGFSTWKFVSFSYDARTGNAILWVDGTAVSTTNVGANFVHPFVGANTGILIATHQSGPRFQGTMACLSIYKTALTAFQIGKLRAHCLADIDEPPSLVELMGFWPMTSLTGLQDISGNELHGVAQSSSSVVQTLGPFGRPNSAYTLGADVDGYIKFNHANLNLNTRSYTISAYVQSQANPINGPILEYLNAASASNINWWLVDDKIVFNDNNGVVPSVKFWTIGGSGWHFLSVVFDSENRKLSLWKNGALISSLTSTSNAATTFGFNVGAKVSGTDRLKANISCLSVYNVALDADGIGQVMSMCNSYIMDEAMRDPTRSELETNCDFDKGFCGWTQGVTDQGDWVLGHDSTPTGQQWNFGTGPRIGKSTEKLEDLDQYALLNAAAIGFSAVGRMISPVVGAGWHCFEMWYYMGGANMGSLNVKTVDANQWIIQRSGYQGKNWLFAASSFYLEKPDQVVIEGTTGTTKYSDIAVDSIKVTEGRCGGKAPCPRGWIDFGTKCYLDLTHMVVTYATAKSHCRVRAKARIALPETEEELAFLQQWSTNAKLIHLGADRPDDGPTWYNSEGQVYRIIRWAIDEPDNGQRNLGLMNGPGNPNGTHSSHGSKWGFLCEVYKIEAENLGFNCTFDQRHLCGWWNINGDSNENVNGNPSADVDIYGSYALPYDYSKEDGQNGPEWDFNLGNTRGMYALPWDGAVTSCSSMYTDFYSPIVRRTGPQCLRFRVYRTLASVVEVYPWMINKDGNAWWGPKLPLTSFEGPHWRTLQLEYEPGDDFMIIIRIYYSCNGKTNTALDDIQLFDGSCNTLLFQWAQEEATSVYNYKQSSRPSFPSWDQSTNSQLDYDNNQCPADMNWGYTRRYAVGSSWNVGCTNWGLPGPKYRRTGPQNDYGGEYYYIHSDTWLSPRFSSRFVGPPVPRGQRCVIFHYFMFGYDVGEMRLMSQSPEGQVRYWFALQRGQYPAWRQHRLLLSETRATQLIYEFSGAESDGVTHFGRFGTMQLDDIFVRNGTDLCMGWMDCDFETSTTACGWQQNDTDDGEWVRNRGETPIGNQHSGPVADHSTGVGHYLYVDATGQLPGARTRIHMPPLAQGQYCLTFHYYMWGADMGSLRVFNVPQSNTAAGSGVWPAYSELTVWQRSGNQGNQWIRAMVPLSLNYPQVLTFESIRGTGDRADIAIDDVVVLKGKCPSDRGYSCSFERGDTCSWYHDPAASSKFIVNSKKTESAPLAGPEGDLTGAYAGGNYIYLKAKGLQSGNDAILTSPAIPAGVYCFQVAYNMRGRAPGFLKVLKNSEELLSLLTGSTSYDWRFITLTVNSNSTFQMRLRATRGQSNLAEIALDDISLTEGPCSGENVPPPPGNIFQWDMKPAFVLKGHNMTLNPVALPKLALCLSKCRDMPGCLSVNYDKTSGNCTMNDATAQMDPYNIVAETADFTYAGLTTEFSQELNRRENLCDLDSPVCILTSNCSTTSLAADMLACQCVETGRSCFMPLDCTSVLKFGIFGSGQYVIQPGVSANQFQVRCEIDPAANKAATVIAQRSNGGVKFNNRNFAEYQNFFGAPSGEYWLGLENMYALTNQPGFKYTYNLVGGRNLNQGGYTPITSSSIAPSFKVGDAASNYQLTLTPGSSTFLSNMNNQPFSTADKDQTGTNSCPVKAGFAGWWFSNDATCSQGLLTAAYRAQEPNIAGTGKQGLYVAGWGSEIGLSWFRWELTRAL